LCRAELATEQLAAIDDPDTGWRGGPEPTDITLENFGRPIPALIIRIGGAPKRRTAQS
jgi:hypothetical protein